MKIYTYGADERLEACRTYLSDKKLPFSNGICLLPIPTARGGELVESICRETLRAQMPSFDLAVGYAVPRSLKEEFSEYGVTVLDVERDEEFLSDNAALTAYGAIGRILTEERVAPTDLSIGVIGYGRIGKRLVRDLTFLGADVTVFTSRSVLRLELGMIGVKTFCSTTAETEQITRALKGLDILINTAPAGTVGESSKDALSGVRVIELASGDNFPTGVAVEKMMSVPAKMYPVSAGKVLAKSIIRMLGEA